MANSDRRHGVSLGSSAIYRIVVQGVLDAEFSDRLSGMSIEVSEGCPEDRASESTLTGRLSDQAQLLGVLNALYEMHLPILEMERKPECA
jgi:hypothetical protein